ncbi:MAG: hypothetical protein NT171_18320 [Planctomycetota bacterium]|nr:hypothetical protein [Planctomycetota bacterium]
MNRLFQSLRSLVAAITLAAELSMPRSVARRLLFGIVIFAAWVLGAAPREARAFHGHHGGCHGGFGFGQGGFGQCGLGGWGGGGLSYGGSWGGYGWGVPCWPVIGNVSYGTGFAVGGTRFWSGTTVFGVPAFGGWGGCGPVWGAPAWGGCGPAWCAPVWGGGWGGAPCGGVGAWYGGWNRGPAWGWNRGPARGWNRGPARGWAIPFASVSPINRLPVGRGQLGAPAIDPAVEVTIRTSNAPARSRAARLVVLGDRHLRGAIDEPAKLAKAIDAYRRAANIAPDQPDTFLRQAIALTAAGKKSAAATAIARAVAIDPRLVENMPAAGGREPLIAPPAGLATTPLVARSSKLLARIFATPDSGRNAPADNWIAHRWVGRDAGPVMVAARP